MLKALPILAFVSVSMAVCAIAAALPSPIGSEVRRRPAGCHAGSDRQILQIPGGLMRRVRWYEISLCQQTEYVSSPRGARW